MAIWDDGKVSICTKSAYFISSTSIFAYNYCSSF